MESQVSGEDGVLDHSQHLAVLAGAQAVQDPVAVQVEDDQRLVEVVSLQGRARVELRQRGVGRQLVTVVCPCDGMATLLFHSMPIIRRVKVVIS